MFFNLDKSMTIQKCIFILTCLFVVTSCVRPDITVPKSRYNSEALSKDWRSNISEQSRPFNTPSYRQPYNNNPAYTYPADNDADYVAPKYEYRLVPVQPKQQQYYPNEPYRDNDASAAPAYPRYDPDADNDSYYYLNKDKTLPPPSKTNSNTEEQYDYPIYFD